MNSEAVQYFPTPNTCQYLQIQLCLVSADTFEIVRIMPIINSCHTTRTHVLVSKCFHVTLEQSIFMTIGFCVHMFISNGTREQFQDYMHIGDTYIVI